MEHDHKNCKAPLFNGMTRFFATEDGGKLRVDSGDIALEFRLRRNVDTRGDEPIDTLSCLIDIVDCDGNLWEAESTFSLRVFVENLVNLDRTSSPIFFEEADEEWQEAFRECQVTGASTLLDDRFYRKILVGDAIVNLQFKYQSPYFDIAFYRDRHCPDLTSLLVRVSDLHDVEGKLISPIIYQMKWQSLIFKNELYFDREEDWWIGDGWPLPIVFKKAGRSDATQILVRYEGNSSD